ncbi:hypothetical protein GGR51DRAFT_287409 [Nemania sp. FL0031]|nr:hypothetical protein GGR51DRAFT_287409 [Nemania sp. FL0031]
MQGQNEGEKGEESEEALGMSEYTSNLLSQGIRQGEPEHLNQRNNDSTTHNNLNTKAAPTYSPEISVGDQHDGSHPSVIEQVASGLNATTTEDSHRGNTAESPILGRPSRPRTSKPKVKFGCDNCEQRRIKCDERRPACTQCVRLGKTCPGYYPPPRVKLYERPDIAPRLAALAAEIPNIRVAGFITPSQTTSTPDGYSSGSPSGVWLAGTSSSGGGTQTDRTVPNDSSLSDIMWIQNATYTVANDLYAKIGADQLSDLKIKQISNSLPRLLRALARNIGYQYQTKLQYDIMVFINTVSK